MSLTTFCRDLISFFSFISFTVKSRSSRLISSNCIALSRSLACFASLPVFTFGSFSNSTLSMGVMLPVTGSYTWGWVPRTTFLLTSSFLKAIINSPEDMFVLFSIRSFISVSDSLSLLSLFMALSTLLYWVLLNFFLPAFGMSCLLTGKPRLAAIYSISTSPRVFLISDSVMGTSRNTFLVLPSSCVTLS